MVAGKPGMITHRMSETDLHSDACAPNDFHRHCQRTQAMDDVRLDLLHSQSLKNPLTTLSRTSFPVSSFRELPTPPALIQRSECSRASSQTSAPSTMLQSIKTMTAAARHLPWSLRRLRLSGFLLKAGSVQCVVPEFAMHIVERLN